MPIKRKKYLHSNFFSEQVNWDWFSIKIQRFLWKFETSSAWGLFVGCRSIDFWSLIDCHRAFYVNKAKLYRKCTEKMHCNKVNHKQYKLEIIFTTRIRFTSNSILFGIKLISLLLKHLVFFKLLSAKRFAEVATLPQVKHLTTSAR